MKRQKQIQLSKQTISEALLKLLQKYDFGHITISLITAEAGVARTTFYRNFDSIEDILLYSLNSAFDSAFEQLEAKQQPTIRDLIEWRVDFAAKNPHFIYIESSPFLQLMLNKFSSQKRGKLMALIQPAGTDVDAYRFVYHQHGIQAVIREWVQSGFQRSKQDIIELLLGQIATTSSR